MSAQSLKCPDCGRPLAIGIQPEDHSAYLYCVATFCNPLRVENLSNGKVRRSKRKLKRVLKRSN